MTSRPHTRPRSRAWMLGPIAIAVVALLAPPGSSTAAPTPGGSGTDTALAATDSKVTVTGRGVNAGLTISVNQTKDLTNQAVSIEWSGATETRQGPGDFGAHFMQIFQCWGEDDGTVPGNPGPPPEQCQQGAVAGQPGGVTGTSYPNGFSLYRIITKTDLPNAAALAAAGVGVVDTRTRNVWMPFRAVNGTVIDIQDDPTFNPSVQGGNFWLNTFFNIVTTNEIVAARTGPDGRGSELFQVNTGRQSPGLGCGQRVQPGADGTKTIPKCWIVVVPRGEPAAENAGMGNFETEANSFGVYSSPLSPVAWKNRIAIPIEFQPVDSPCTIADVERRIAGSEIALSAIASWQPALCADGSLPPFSFSTVGDPAARQQLASSVAGGPGMVVVSRPVASTSEDPKSPVVYAPLTVSGLVIGFNIERIPKTDAPAGEQLLRGVRISDINLTPRLVAKLLTQSYSSQVNVGNSSPGYAWATVNPVALGADPDFLRFNEEFAFLQASGRMLGGMVMPSGGSDAAQLLWEWVLADPEANAWLRGAPDEWGMKVNPVYATDPAVNPSGIAFGDPIPNSFPKSDPYCYQAPARGPGRSVVPTPLCGTDWMPYSRTFLEGARNTRAGNDEAKIVENSFAIVSSDVWKRDVPQAPGSRAMIAVTDTVSATRFGLQMARLSRAGDNGDNREFVAPDTAALVAATGAMEPRSNPQVLEPKMLDQPAGAYPLTMIAYAAIKPLSQDPTARAEYAEFIDYASGAGQEPGFEFGKLPSGYAPLPESLASQSETAAEVVRDPVLAALVPPATSSTTTSVPGAAATVTSPALPAVVAASPTRTNSSTTRPAASSGASSGVVTDESTAVSEPTEATEPAAPATSVPAVDVVETTIAAAAQSAPTTPGIDLGSSRFLVVAIGVIALLAALFALEITKRTRQATDEPATSLALEYQLET